MHGSAYQDRIPRILFWVADMNERKEGNNNNKSLKVSKSQSLKVASSQFQVPGAKSLVLFPSRNPPHPKKMRLKFRLGRDPENGALQAGGADGLFLPSERRSARVSPTTTPASAFSLHFSSFRSAGTASLQPSPGLDKGFSHFAARFLHLFCTSSAPFLHLFCTSSAPFPVE